MQKQSPTGKRTAFVTGASYGIGAATALALARNGFDVAVAATRVENLSNVVAQLEATGARVVPVALDLRANSSIEQTMAAVTGAFGNLDVLVNNASVPLRKAATEVTPEEWDAVMQPNLTGTFFMCQQMGRHLIGSGRPGCIINIASTHGIVALAARLVYGVSKAAVMHMTKMLAIEWAQHGIRVNSIAPGTVDTPSRAAFLADPKTREMMLNRVPLHRLGTADEVAAAVCYLASPEAAYITGHTLVMDGGLTSY
ncbi:MAG: glucose 1-dehydrogenase [Betaproteobacteria bacterium]|nr:glucose 1-dehydrogenase [Betaproteobacteria bacterium]MBI3057535.1 glucose 1-dehydrogenase [Betaproteobacteria bacterium]